MSVARETLIDIKGDLMNYKCEYNPILREAALELDSERDLDCKNEATIVVGSKGQFHLCDTCSELKEFNRFKKQIINKKYA